MDGKLEQLLVITIVIQPPSRARRKQLKDEVSFVAIFLFGEVLFFRYSFGLGSSNVGVNYAIHASPKQGRITKCVLPREVESLDQIAALDT